MPDRVQVSGGYAGPFSRLLAFILDSVIVTATFALISALINYIGPLLTSHRIQPDDAHGLWWSVGLIVWTFAYNVVSLIVAARTPGKAMVGLRVVSRRGSPLRPRAALVRVLVEPITFLTFGIGFIGVVIGRERRALHDMVASTAVVYDWGDRPAELPTPLSRYVARAGETAR